MENSIIVEVSCPTASIEIVDYPADKTWSVEITNMTESEDKRADFNKNGWVDIGDAAKISFYLAQKVSEL